MATTGTGGTPTSPKQSRDERAASAARAAEVDRFSKQAPQYALSRPTYPRELLQAVSDALTSVSAKRNLAVDACCGSGQLTHALALPPLSFSSVLGVDTSEPQLSHAVPESPAVSFQRVDAHRLPVACHSVDLLTVAQGLHWLDFDRFMLEARRVLKRDTSVLAVAGYARPEFPAPDQTAVQDAFSKYYLGTLRSHRDDSLWDIDRRRVDSAFDGEEFEAHFRDVQRLWFRSPVPNATARSVLEFLETQSVYQKFKPAADAGRIPDPLDPIAAAMGIDRRHPSAADARPITCVFPFYVVLCSHPLAEPRGC